MDLYTQVAYATSRHLTLRYSSSFGISSRLFPRDIQPHIYAIYGLVRIADEIVDTYRGPDARARLDELESTTLAALKTGFDVNPIVHAFALTARQYEIPDGLIRPFFASMRMDLPSSKYSQHQYQEYIYGSAEVVGLMCLRVFCNNDTVQYNNLEKGARALGSAYQKINFLRDLLADYKELGRVYFPGITFESFDENMKLRIIQDIRSDLRIAQSAIVRLPRSSRSAVKMSYVYYNELLKRLDAAPVAAIKAGRIRIPSRHKIQLLAKTLIKEKFNA
jgi:phytoene/squalene synthetase